jgi:parvulin-like peptidyl-prolyl isomerase
MSDIQLKLRSGDLQMNRKWLAGAACVLTIATAACASDASDEGVVARVGDNELMVDEAVELLVDQEGLAADAGVVESLAGLWADYTLLAEAAARDSTFSELDLEPMVQQQLDQMMVFQLRDSVIQVDTFVTDEELRTMYETEAPAVEMRARHIMLQLPLQSTPAQRDSVRARLEALRVRLVGGESFELLAAQYSQDPGTARAGGDLGYFQRGDMVAPFEEATLALAPGELSGVVETPMGLHLIRLDERRVRGFEDAASRFRQQVQARMVQQAESLYVSALIEQVDPAVTEGSLDIVREMAVDPGAMLSGRAERRPLVEWETGDLKVRDVRVMLQLEAPQFRSQLANGTDEQLGDFLISIARRELLVRAAESEGLRLPADSVAALVEVARTQLRTAARTLGLLDLDQAPGEDLEVAVSRAVEEALTDNLTGATQIVPLGIVSFQLREGRPSTVFSAGVGEVIVAIARIRAARALSPIEQTIDSAIASADTAGR